jgi:serine protease Do/serine protease DegQ
MFCPTHDRRHTALSRPFAIAEARAPHGRRKTKMIRIMRAALIAGAMATAIGLGSSAYSASLPASVDGKDVPSLAPLLQEVSPAVVNIATRGKAEMTRHPLFDDPFFRRFFGDRIPREQRENQSVGSGVIVDAKAGYLLTNHHVIDKADEVMVTLTDRRQLKAKVVGSDPDTDIAVLKVDPINLRSVPLADSDHLLVGDYVVAIGNPFGLGQTVTAGIVSALGRSGLGIEGYEDFIQTDASINPGNSGGALINLKGELVGINTAIIAPGGGNIGIGFAIPINMARGIMDQIIAHGEVQRGRIGVQIQDLTPELAEAFKVDVTAGAVVSQVTPGSPAEEAGVKAGDVITKANGLEIDNSADLRNRIGLMRVGDKVTLKLIRDGKEIEIAMTVGEVKEASVGGSAGNAVPKLEGAVFGVIPETSPLRGQVEGVAVLDVQDGSPAYNAGLRKDDVITSVDRKPVRKPEELLSAARAAGDALLLNVRRGDGALFIFVR